MRTRYVVYAVRRDRYFGSLHLSGRDGFERQAQVCCSTPTMPFRGGSCRRACVCTSAETSRGNRLTVGPLSSFTAESKRERLSTATWAGTTECLDRRWRCFDDLHATVAVFCSRNTKQNNVARGLEKPELHAAPLCLPVLMFMLLVLMLMMCCCVVVHTIKTASTSAQHHNLLLPSHC